MNKKMCLACAMVFLLWSMSVLADVINGDKTLTPLQIFDSWQPKLPAVLPVRAGYFTLRNDSVNAVEIVGVSSTDFSSVEMHQSTVTNNISGMRSIAALTIPAGATVAFRPNALHLMLRNALKQHVVGDQYPISLHLSDGRTQSFLMSVVPAHNLSNDSNVAVRHEHSVHHH